MATDAKASHRVHTWAREARLVAGRPRGQTAWVDFYRNEQSVRARVLPWYPDGSLDEFKALLRPEEARELGQWLIDAADRIEADKIERDASNG